MKKGGFEWTESQQQAFDTLKQKMVTAPVLTHLNYEESFILYINASYEGLGFIFVQEGPDGKKHLVQYDKRKLKPTEKNYIIINLECLGIVWSIKKTW